MADADTVTMTRAAWIMKKLEKCRELRYQARFDLAHARIAMDHAGDVAHARIAVGRSEGHLGRLADALEHLEYVLRPLLAAEDAVPLTDGCGGVARFTEDGELVEQG